LQLPINSEQSKLSPGSQVTLGIRPRNLALQPESAQDTLSLKIDLIEPMGAETLAHLTYKQNELRVVTDWRTDLTEGDSVHARFLPESTHVFSDNGELVTTL